MSLRGHSIPAILMSVPFFKKGDIYHHLPEKKHTQTKPSLSPLH